MKNKSLGVPCAPRLRVAFFQRIFAHYQAGLVRELAENSRHEYHFFGADRDPTRSGLETLPAALRTQVSFSLCRTLHWGKYVAFQWRAIYVAFFGDFDTYILEGNFTIATHWLAVPVARLRGKRVLLYTHGWLSREFGCKGWLRKCFYRLSNGLLLYGNRARQIGIESGFPPEKLYVVNNSLDMVKIDHCRDSILEVHCNKFRTDWFGENAAKPLILSVGRLTAVKEYSLLLEAVKLLQLQGIDTNVMLVGEGPDRASIQKRAAELGLSLTLPGERYDEEFLGVCFSAADLVVVPGAAGLTVIHSLSYGTPLVVHSDECKQMPEFEAVKDSVNGALFHSGDAGDLARSIKIVLNKLPRSPQVAYQCRAIVDAAYTPPHMRAVIDRAVSGQ